MRNNRFWQAAVLAVCTGCLPGLDAAAQIITNTFNATGSFTPPAGITSVTVEAWGGGGGGAAAATGRAGAVAGAALSRGTLTVVPAQSYTVTVGAGGASDTAGGDSWFGTSGTLMAKGGSGGTANSATGAGRAESAPPALARPD
ncbi:MAG: hypothetical protein U1F77_19530 [Kiritimatiellia bacterium]